MYARVSRGGSRSDFELRGPLNNVLRACDAVVAHAIREDGERRVERACDAAPLPTGASTWFERVDEQAAAAIDRRVDDDCPMPFPMAFTLITRTQSGPFADEAACKRDDVTDWYLQEVASLKGELVRAEADLRTGETRHDTECPAVGPLDCSGLEIERDRLKRHRDVVAALLEKMESARCVAR